MVGQKEECLVRLPENDDCTMAHPSSNIHHTISCILMSMQSDDVLHYYHTNYHTPPPFVPLFQESIFNENLARTD
eukprot:scaffold1335_cov282-Chaetoceros_neogracile.AAC.5